MIKPLIFGALGLGIVVAGAVYARAGQNVETPPYTVERSAGDIEVRLYPELVLAQVTRQGSRRSAVQSGFPPLARYIFAKNRPGEKIAMTAPVVQEPAEGGWVVSFIMPAGRRVEDLPAPATDVRITIEPARRVAAIRFSGTWSDARLARAAQQLKAWAADQGLETAGPVEFAYYNDPFTPPFLRRNEVLLPLAR